MGTCVSAPVSSNKQSTIPSAAPDATAKFVPASVTVAPSGKWLPGSVPVAGQAVAGSARGPERPAGSGVRGADRWPARRWRSWRGVPLDEPDYFPDGADFAVASADDVGDDPGPAGLVEGADGGAVVAVEVFAEDQVVVPGGVGLQELGAAEAGPPAVGTAGEDRDQPVLQVGGDLIQGQLGA